MSLNSTKKVRLDSLLVVKGLIESREKARALILEGKVLVNGIKANKAGTFVRPNASLEILQKIPYVSRGGLKLEGALRSFNINVKDKIGMDVGASTGGFTDCLLQHGAKKVYAVDVGYGQLAWKLRNNPRVILLEKTNIRYLDEKVRLASLRSGSQVGISIRIDSDDSYRGSGRKVPWGVEPRGGPRRGSWPTGLYEHAPIRGHRPFTGVRSQKLEDLIESNIDIATVDVSFISLLKVIPKVINFLKKNGEIVALIKPQFEVARKDVRKGGVVKDEAKRLEVIEKITKEVRGMGLEVKEIVKSQLVGPKGNIEYFIYLKRK